MASQSFPPPCSRLSPFTRDPELRVRLYERLRAYLCTSYEHARRRPSAALPCHVTRRLVLPGALRAGLCFLLSALVSPPPDSREPAEPLVGIEETSADTTMSVSACAWPTLTPAQDVWPLPSVGMQSPLKKGRVVGKELGTLVRRLGFASWLLFCLRPWVTHFPAEPECPRL